MSNEFRGEGNLGVQPTLKKVMVDGEPHSVAELRIFFDRFKNDGQGNYLPNGGFWLTGSIWDKRAEACVEHLQRGARVHAIGELVQETWQDRETGGERSEFKLNLDAVYPSLMKIEEVRFKAKHQVPPLAALEVGMYLDAAEEKMLRAIVQSAVASAAAGCPFAGTFRHYRISAVRLRVNEVGIAQVEARIVADPALWPKSSRKFSSCSRR